VIVRTYRHSSTRTKTNNGTYLLRESLNTVLYTNIVQITGTLYTSRVYT